jgi:hypothetical protein
MGDRSNIVIQFADDDDQKEIVFYTHWGGSDLPATLQAALLKAKNTGRLDDDAYLARIIFCTMVSDDPDGSTGYGIAPWISEEEHETIYVDTEVHTVTIGDLTWSYEDYINQHFQ